jgi:hypothetical protein
MLNIKARLKNHKISMKIIYLTLFHMDLESYLMKIILGLREIGVMANWMD